jgi:hypothetical protein
MQAIISRIDVKQKEYENHAFFTQLLSNQNIPGQRRLSWAPSIIPFIMGYSDINKYIFRKEKDVGQAEPLQALLNAHTYEEDFHWQWMLNDLGLLDADKKMSLSDAVRVMWSDDLKHSRRLCLELAALAVNAPTYCVFAMVESIEAVSITIFKHCQGIATGNGKECEFFGKKHYVAESSHSIKSPEFTASKLPTLSDMERIEALAMVERVFALFDEWSHSLLRYAGENEDHSAAYERMVRHSQSMRPELGITAV